MYEWVCIEDYLLIIQIEKGFKCNFFFFYCYEDANITITPKNPFSSSACCDGWTESFESYFIATKLEKKSV